MSTSTTSTTPPQAVLTPYITTSQINARLDTLADELNADYAGQSVVLVSVLKGSFMFLADLIRRLTFDCTVEFVRLASYEGTSSTGSVKPVELSLPVLKDKHVLIIEDIVDTGLTLNMFLEYLKSVHQPASVKIAVFLDKKAARQHAITPHFVGFDIQDQFVVGYGLDADGRYRNLPEVCILEQPSGS
ncbi:MAG: hypoxanthine phosphoribosyltransferase [Vampirovibrionales bacterium]